MNSSQSRTKSCVNVLMQNQHHHKRHTLLLCVTSKLFLCVSMLITLVDIDLLVQLAVAVPTAAVQHVMLQHEEQVEEDREETETELGRVAEDRAPVICSKRHNAGITTHNKQSTSNTQIVHYSLQKAERAA